jgi:hypothetical protein
MDLPLVVPILSRDGTLTKDAKTINLLNGEKRPGLLLAMQLPAGTAQGMFLSPTLGACAIVNNIIYKVSTGAAIASITSGVGPYDAVVMPVSGTVVIKDAGNMWLLNGSVLTAVVRSVGNPLPTAMLPGIVQLDQTCYVLSGVTVYGSAIGDPSTWTALNEILVYGGTATVAVAISRYLNYVLVTTDQSTEVFYDNGNPAPGSPLSRYPSAYSTIGCASAQSLVDMQNMALHITKDKDNGRVVRGINNLQSSNLSTWAIEKILQRSTLVGLTSFGLTMFGHSLYVVNLSDINITLYYDITTNQWGQLTYSKARGAKVISSLTNNSRLATAVCTAHGLSDGDPVDIAGVTQASYNGRFNIKVLDVDTFQFTIPAAAISPATGSPTVIGYDQNLFCVVNVQSDGAVTYAQDATTGAIYQFSATTFTDNGAPIDCQSVTGNVRGDTTATYIHFQEAELEADKVTSTALVRYTKDDYQTWSYYGNLYLGDTMTSIQRLGAGHIRAFHFRHTDNTSIRVRKFIFAGEDVA